MTETETETEIKRTFLIRALIPSWWLDSHDLI